MDQRPLGKAVQIVVRVDEGICKGFPAAKGVESLYINVRQPVAKISIWAGIAYPISGFGCVGGVGQEP